MNMTRLNVDKAFNKKAVLEGPGASEMGTLPGMYFSHWNK